jgi:single-strand DNA-binding protein
MRYTPKGTAIVQGGIAVNRVWTGDDGQKKEKVLFVDFKAFGRTAETIMQYTRKGHAILFNGRLELDMWDDKQTGQKRYKHFMFVETFQFLDNKGRDENAATGKNVRLQLLKNL